MLDRTTQDRWDARYREAGLPGAPATVLLENAHLLPREGTALALACGLGANALLLAERELLSMFAPLRPLVYREEGRVGDLAQGFRNKALLVAIKDPHRGDCMKAMQD